MGGELLLETGKSLPLAFCRFFRAYRVGLGNDGRHAVLRTVSPRCPAYGAQYVVCCASLGLDCRDGCLDTLWILFAMNTRSLTILVSFPNHFCVLATVYGLPVTRSAPFLCPSHLGLAEPASLDLD